VLIDLRRGKESLSQSNNARDLSLLERKYSTHAASMECVSERFGEQRGSLEIFLAGQLLFLAAQ
jgi:hypothetical protein